MPMKTVDNRTNVPPLDHVGVINETAELTREETRLGLIWDSGNCFFLFPYFLFFSESIRNWSETLGTAFLFSFLSIVFLKVLQTDCRLWKLLFSFLFFPLYFWNCLKLIWNSRNCFFLYPCFIFIFESTQNWFETPVTAFFFFFLS